MIVSHPHYPGSNGFKRVSPKILKEIDFASLKDIILQDAKRTGAAHDFNFVEKNQIRTSRQEATAEGSEPGEYNGLANLIQLDAPGIQNLATRWQVSPKLVTLMLLCHEETHATGLVENRGMIEFYGDGAEHVLETTGVAKRSGVGSHTVTLKGEEFIEQQFFQLLEEGIVEKSSQETFIEYLRRNPGFATPAEIGKLQAIRR